LLEAFLRMRTFQSLNQIDLFHSFLPPRMQSEELLVMMAASTGCALVRCVQLANSANMRPRLVRRAIHDDDGHICVLEEGQVEM
jgi:hypothetical protein